MVCQVMFTTPDEDDDADDDGEAVPPAELDDPGGPLQAAMASVAHAASVTGAANRKGNPFVRFVGPEAAGGILRGACIFLITRCSFCSGVHQVPAARVGPDPRGLGGGPALSLMISSGAGRRA